MLKLSSSIFIAILLLFALTLSNAYISSPLRIARSSASSKHLIASDSLKQKSFKSLSPSSSFTKLHAAAPEAPKGRGPPPRKAPKDDVVQVLIKLATMLSDNDKLGRNHSSI